MEILKRVLLKLIYLEKVNNYHKQLNLMTINESLDKLNILQNLVNKIVIMYLLRLIKKKMIKDKRMSKIKTRQLFLIIKIKPINQIIKMKLHKKII